ncbi:MAG: hypothetical protein ACTFAL_14000 [Candidatus Electronema sp. V4]
MPIAALAEGRLPASDNQDMPAMNSKYCVMGRQGGHDRLAPRKEKYS